MRLGLGRARFCSQFVPVLAVEPWKGGGRSGTLPAGGGGGRGGGGCHGDRASEIPGLFIPGFVSAEGKP